MTQPSDEPVGLRSFGVEASHLLVCLFCDHNVDGEEITVPFHGQQAQQRGMG